MVIWCSFLFLHSGNVQIFELLLLAVRKLAEQVGGKKTCRASSLLLICQD